MEKAIKDVLSKIIEKTKQDSLVGGREFVEQFKNNVQAFHILVCSCGNEPDDFRDTKSLIRELEKVQNGDYADSQFSEFMGTFDKEMVKESLRLQIISAIKLAYLLNIDITHELENME